MFFELKHPFKVRAKKTQLMLSFLIPLVLLCCLFEANISNIASNCLLEIGK